MMFENENTPLDMLIETYTEQQEIKMVINEYYITYYKNKHDCIRIKIK